ncbi:MAG: hypothetical protein P8Y44_12500 [Acidobacteriota bacterium]
MRSLPTLSKSPNVWVSIAAIAIASSCAPSSEDFATSIELSKFVFHQQANISTELISAVDSTGIDRIAFGLVPMDDPDLGRVFDLQGGMGRLQVFSADGDVTGLDLDAGLATGSSDERLRLLIRWNDKRLRRVTLSPGLDSLRLEVPAGLAVKGLNRLEIQARPGRRQIESGEIPRARIRRIRFHSARDRPLWPQRPDRIRLVEASAQPTRQTVEMPTASFVDMVLAIPKAATLVGSVSSWTPKDQRSGAVEIYSELLDENLEPSELVRKTFSGERPQEHPLHIDLSAWSGQTVRLRFGGSELRARAPAHDRPPATTEIEPARTSRHHGHSSRCRPRRRVLSLWWRIHDSWSRKTGW